MHSAYAVEFGGSPSAASVVAPPRRHLHDNASLAADVTLRTNSAVSDGEVDARQPVRGATTHWPLPTHCEHGSQNIGSPALHAPAWQESATVQPSPSSHALPSGRGT